jgi:hypothetical protein
MGYGDEMDSRVVRGAASSFVSGILFASAWWILIDGYTMGNKQHDAPTAATASYAWVPPFFASLMYFSLNAMVSSKETDDTVANTFYYSLSLLLHFCRSTFPPPSLVLQIYLFLPPLPLPPSI